MPMGQERITNFLSPGIDQIRMSIKDIDDSYNNDWDILAELCQNAVDAIKLTDVEEGIIKLEIDAGKKSIRISDNGCGIKKSRLAYLLKPFSTDKRGIGKTIGEKGVGLTFAMFTGNNFVIKTGTGEEACIGTICNAHSWKEQQGGKELELVIDDLEENFEGTEILIEDVKEKNQFFELTFEQLKFVLRTRTALGSTFSIWEDDRNISIELAFIDINGKRHSEEIPFRYALPYEVLGSSAKIDYDEFVKYASQIDKTDLDKRKKLRDKVIFKKGEYSHTSSRKIKYIACFVPKRKVWDTLSVASRLATNEELEDENWVWKFDYCRITPGTYCSTKGMPTGIKIDHPSTGAASYWWNLFILLEDPFLKFDIGRKSIHGKQTSILREYSKKLFNDFYRNIVKYVSGEAEPNPEWNRDETFEEINGMLDLDFLDIQFKKNPKDQEASVFAIFFECIGNKKITGIAPLIAGHKSKYDLYAKWGTKKLVIEFKSRLRNIITDFSDAQKLFDEIDLIVCWEITDEDKALLKEKLGIEVETIQPNLLSEQTQIIPNSTHKLLLSGFNKPIYVLDLKKFLEEKQDPPKK